jgi:hypothetical protein
MIKTLDGKVLKRGDIGFVVGVTVGSVYAPCRVKAHSQNPSYSVPDEKKVYATRAACQEECDKKNNQK